MASIPPPPRAIGPYQLEELLGRGGMAEVYRARREGPGGFEKVVALKRILPSYARNQTLVQRFLEEARIAGGLTHGNIVPVIDFGEIDGEHYLVMEWVDGVPLSALLRTVAERGRTLPAEVVAHIIAEAAAGLHHAHTRTDASGRPMSIVHRDVSPQNILLARQGDVKISDFGIAKAADSVVRTEAGIQVGKLCYMAPEQAKGEPLDARADVYALGIVLWECLAMRPLFSREEGAEALRGVLEPKHVAPSEVSASAPAALDAVVLKALQPAREDRYPDAGSLARDLRVYVHSVAPGFGQADLAQYLERTLPFQGGAPRAPAPLPAAAPVPATAPSAAAPAVPARAAPWPVPPAGASPGPPLPLDPAAAPSLPRAPARSRAWLLPSILLSLLVFAGAAGAIFFVHSGRDVPTPSSTGAGTTGGAMGSLPPAPGPTPAPPPQAQLVPGQVSGPTPPNGSILIPVAPDAPKLSLRLRTEPPGATIVMEGDVAGVTPMDVQAQTATPMRMGLLLRGHEPVLFPATPGDFPQLAAGANGPPIVLTPCTSTYGLLDVSVPAVGSAHVLVDGVDVGEEPVLVQVLFDGGAPRTHVEVDVPGRGITRLDIAQVAVPWGFAKLEHTLPDAPP